MKMRWFVVVVSDDRIDGAIVGNCATLTLAENVIDALVAQSDKTFRIVGPITENMIHGKLDPKDIELVEAQMEHFEYQQAGGQIH